jgi:hypothetical protein
MFDAAPSSAPTLQASQASKQANFFKMKKRNLKGHSHEKVCESITLNITVV